MSGLVLSFRGSEQDVASPVGAACVADRFALSSGQANHQRGRATFGFGERRSAGAWVHGAQYSAVQKVWESR
jgi:hypothetical protein